MAGLGIYHYGARFYSPKLGRFLSPDTIVPGYTNPQAFNRYSYVLGNPLRYIDPTGHYCVGDDEDCAGEGGNGPAPSGNGGGSNNNGNNGNPHDDDNDIDPNPNNVTLPIPTITHSSTEPNPVISILGVATLLVLAVPETLITFGIIAIAITGGPIGWVVDALVLIPLDLAMFNLSIYAAQMARTGSTDHDVLPLWPGDQ